MTYNSKVGTYAYARTGGANPHAATAVGSSTYSYDLKGNLLSGGGTTFVWDYQNRLTKATTGLGSTDYGYGFGGKRVFKTTGGSTTVYPDRLSEKITNISTSTINNIYLGDELVARANAVGTTTYLHGDHLGSSLYVTDTGSEVLRDFTYGTYGKPDPESGYKDARYIGQEYDESTGLNYLGARYQNGAIGKFISQDPSFLDIGATTFEKDYQRTLQQHLMNPQALNSYSYAHNNPITYKDPDGEILPLILAGLAFYGGYSAGTDLYEGYTSGNNGQLGWGVVGAVSSLIPGEGAAKGAVSLVDDTAKAAIQVARNREAGALAEKAAGIIKNTELIPSVTKPGTNRIPDILDHAGKVIGDVKNVNYQSFTSQLKDFANYAQNNSYKFNLTVDQRTQLSKTLQQLGNKLEVIRKNLNNTKK